MTRREAGPLGDVFRPGAGERDGLEGVTEMETGREGLMWLVG